MARLVGLLLLAMLLPLPAAADPATTHTGKVQTAHFEVRYRPGSRAARPSPTPCRARCREIMAPVSLMNSCKRDYVAIGSTGIPRLTPTSSNSAPKE